MMTPFLWVLAGEYAALAVLLVITWIQRIRDRAAMRRLALHAFTSAPMSTAMPTMIADQGPEWILPAQPRP